MVVDYDSLASTTYDVESYDMLPKYSWGSEFQPQGFSKELEDFNEGQFSKLVDLLEADEAIQGFTQRNLKPQLKGYLTRRIRRITSSKDINELVDRFQIVLPIMVPFKIEEWVKEQFAQALDDAGIPSHNHEILIPVHRPGMGNGVLPDTTESTEENLRFWVIDSTTMWAGIDRRIDEIFELLWVYVTTQSLVSDYLLGYTTSNEAQRDWYEIIASFLLRRVTRMSIQQLGIEKTVAPKEGKGEESENKGNVLVVPNERDRYLFTKWLMEQPIQIYRNYQYEIRSNYRESNNETAPPEIMYWREGTDGSSNEWTEWPEGQPGFEPVATFRKQPKKKARSDGRSNSDDDWADRLPDEDEADDAEGETALGTEPGDAPRGVKRQREESDLADMMKVTRENNNDSDDDDLSMADAPGTSTH
ncbi:hypothetical protein ABW19_dt0201774 [Dactylella cylindrospora]|nr:hypothetical protein ABW19_dt0201774 [Dactylella cylindrospora]